MATCESNGHLWGADRKCVMCKTLKTADDFDQDLVRLEQIRRAQHSARPTHQNPAWVNAHTDCDFLLGFIDKLWQEYTRALQRSDSTPEPPAVRGKFEVLAVCDAYESGFGQGLQNKPMGAYKNPYAAESAEAEAYALGYDKGSQRSNQPPGARHPQEQYVENIEIQDALYELLVRRGYAQHEADYIMRGPHPTPPPSVVHDRPLSAVQRLHNICDALSEQADESPFTREEWERVDKEAVAAQARIRELEAEVSTLREHLAEVNRLMSLNCRTVERLQAENGGLNAALDQMGRVREGDATEKPRHVHISGICMPGCPACSSETKAVAPCGCPYAAGEQRMIRHRDGCSTAGE